MTTLALFSKQLDMLPTSTVWLLERLAEARGRQELFTRQSPQRLKALREHALIESAVSSNRIEGVEIPQVRLKAVLFGRPVLKDRNEEEVRGYRQALDRIHQRGAKTEMIEAAVASQKEAFTLANLETACPGVSRDMIRRILKDMQGNGRIECLGRGPGAPWKRKEGIIPKRGQ